MPISGTDMLLIIFGMARSRIFLFISQFNSLIYSFITGIKNTKHFTLSATKLIIN